MVDRDYDIVIYGASGFTGRQAVAYLARHAPPGVRWAIAGRHRGKLDAIRTEVGAPVDDSDVLVADSERPDLLDGVVSRTRVLLSTAGPFALYGTPVVESCVRFNTHYVDITGETAWAASSVVPHHERLAASGTRVIPFCGFDSVPSDLGTYLLVRHLQQSGPLPRLEVRTFFRVGGGGLNGGTAATLLHISKTRTASVRRETAARTLDSADFQPLESSFLARPEAGPAKTAPREAEPRRNMLDGLRRSLTPHYDSVLGAWVGPFYMGPINAWVVKRSAALYAARDQPYPALTYRELHVYPGPFARAKAWATTLAAGLLLAGLQRGPTRRVIAAFLPKPGQGPSEEQMDRGWFESVSVGLVDGHPRARVVVRNRGDVGNRSTVTFVCEAALALALDSDRLPGGPGTGGVLTPATRLGDILVERLRRAGVTLEVHPEGSP
ncbi:MAG: saccharopine dehydrogenase family protein [Acidobacteriota bacterium]